jgi:mannuronan 5-epimerase
LYACLRYRDISIAPKAFKYALYNLTEDGSLVKGNNIHDLYFGFYSKGVGGIKIENNYVHNNIHYGLDPHTGTHDMIIKNNTVHEDGSIEIICSLDCYNISIENNTVYNNTKMGIMLSRNMTNSIARDNIVGNEGQGIVISESLRFTITLFHLVVAA